MRVVILWRERRDYSRDVTDWLREFNRRTGKTLESMDPDTREGSNFARIYDIVQYPTIIATADDGKEQHRWAGTPLPLINDVSYYTLSN